MKTRMNKVEAAMKRIVELEARAQRLQMQLDRTKEKWQADIDLVRDTPEWQKFCDLRGTVTRYDFGDVLA